MKHQYTDTIRNKTIAVLGPLPPPLGGVSVHVGRVIARLKHHNDVVHFETCVEYRYRFFAFYVIRLLLFLLRYRPHEIHLHTLYLSNGLSELIWIMRLKRLMRYDVILMEHDCRYMYKQSQEWKNKLNSLLPHVKKQIFMGNVTELSYRDNSMQSAQAVSTESAFLPPDRTDEHAILSSYPQDLFDFINQHTPVLLANAFQLSLLEGKDLYGIDQCLSALHTLKDEYTTIGFVFALATIGNKAYYDELIDSMQRYGIQHHCYMLIGQRPLWPLINKVDLFVRPTLSDGASVSIEEALWMNKPVVASNVCARPKDVITYNVSHSDDFCAALRLAIARFAC